MRLPIPTVLRQVFRNARAALALCKDVCEITRLRNEVEWQAMELALFREQRAAIPARNRPRWTPSQRARALLIRRLRGENRAALANRMGVGEDTVRRWEREELLGATNDADTTAHNRLDDAVRQLVHDVRAALPDLNVGTRSIAALMMRAGVKAGRTSIQRFLREKPPQKKGPEAEPVEKPERVAEKADIVSSTFGPLKPEAKSEAWHLDFTVIRVLWFSLSVIGLMDGHSRKCLALKLGKKEPGTAEILAIVEVAIGQYGKPAVIITDRGGQFQAQFVAVLTLLDITHLQGPAQRPQFNGKIERLFKTVKGGLLAATVWLPWRKKKLQAVLDQWREWYNAERPHQAVGNRMPKEVWNGAPAATEPVAYLARDANKVKFKLTRQDHGGLGCCPTLKLEVIDLCKAA